VVMLAASTAWTKRRRIHAAYRMRPNQRRTGPTATSRHTTAASRPQPGQPQPVRTAATAGTANSASRGGRPRDRHRLNRGGDRAANCALYRIVLCRLRHDPANQAYAERRTKQGLSKPEIIRCLKRYVLREVYRALLPLAPPTEDLAPAASQSIAASQLTFRYHLGADATAPWADVPAGDVTYPGTTTHPVRPLTRTGASFSSLMWNVAATVGAAPDGPVQALACLSPTGGATTCSAPATFTYARAAVGDSYATAEVGPGTQPDVCLSP